MPQIMSHQPESKIESNVPVEVVESWKRALAELIEIALNDKIRDCIRLYNPEKPSKDNKKALKACRKDSIIETLNFLSKATNKDMNKDIAIDKLCLKIKNFFPDICQICDQSYIVKYEDKPLLNCGSCGQEVHRLCYLKLLRSMKLINDNEEMSELLYKIPGLYYLCPSCQDETISFTYNKQNTDTISSKTESSSTKIDPIDKTNDTEILINESPDQNLTTQKKQKQHFR